jgi:cyanophycin synthetase
MAVATAAAGHFDHYICRRFPEMRGRKEHEISKLLKTGLLRAGISPEHITVPPDPSEAVRQTLQMGKAGDLLVLIPSSKEKYAMWEQIISC